MPKPSSKDEGFLLPVASVAQGWLGWLVNPAQLMWELALGVMLSTVMQEIDSIASSERVEKIFARRLTRW